MSCTCNLVSYYVNFFPFDEEILFSKKKKKRNLGVCARALLE